jgi:diamine N-acetyltransferase
MDVSFQQATIADLPKLLPLMRTYYAEDDYPFHEAKAHCAAGMLLGDPAIGRCWLIFHGEDLIGYVVLTFGFSLEYQGRDAFVDELFVLPAWRGKGIGKQALAIVEAACVEGGVTALHLEVERNKTAAQALYRRCGFVDKERFLMTKRMS